MEIKYYMIHNSILGNVKSLQLSGHIFEHQVQVLCQGTGGRREGRLENSVTEMEWSLSLRTYN